MTPVTDDDSLNSMVMAVQLELGAFGWKLAVSHADPPPGRMVAFIHPLALTYDVAILDNLPPSEVRRNLDWACNNYRDIALTRELPVHVYHHALMFQLRVEATANEWATGSLRGILLALPASDWLTEAEAVWMLQAGPALVHARSREWEVLPREDD